MDIQNNGIHCNEGERVQVMLAAGEFPDVGNIWGQNGDPVSLVEEGITRTIPQEWVRQFAPNLSKLYDQYPLAWLANTDPENREEFAALNGLASQSDYLLRFFTFRADWAQKVGFDMPDYESRRVPLDRFGRTYYYDQDYTIDQFEDLLRKFRDMDPDGNGVNDTIPFATNKDIYRYWGPLMGMFGNGNATLEMSMVVDGQLTLQAIAPTHKEFLKRMNKWYEQGLMDREFVNLDFWKSVEKITNHQTAAYTTNVLWTGRGNLANRPPNVGLSEEEIAQGKHYVMIPPVIGPNGERGCEAYSSTGAIRSYNVNASVSDAKLKRFLELFDWFRGTVKGQIYTSFGKPEVHFDYNYVAEWKKAGGAQLIAELEKTPLVEALVKGEIKY